MIAAVNVTTTAAEVLQAKAGRKMLILQNTSDADIYVKLDSSATEVTTANGLKLPPNSGPFMVMGSYHNAVRAIHGSSGNKVLRIQEE
jgi:hypothetical protein